MAGLADLVRVSQPALFDEGTEDAQVTEGKTWRWTLEEIEDDSGNPIDLTPGAGVTGVCKILDKNLVDVVVDVEFTGHADGSLDLEVDSTETVGLADGATVSGRSCRWYLTLSDTTVSPPVVVPMWMPLNSPIVINPAGA